MGVDGPFKACLSSRRAICARKIGRFQRTYQKCSDDFSAKALICRDPTPDFAQVGLIRECTGVPICIRREPARNAQFMFFRQTVSAFVVGSRFGATSKSE